MDQLPLHRHERKASRLIFGCMSLGGGWTRAPLSEELVLEAERAIDAALEVGITMFDHDDFYAYGRAEEVFGEVLRRRRGLRERIVIQSKVGIRLADSLGPNRYDLSTQHIVSSVDGILRRLGVEQIDVLLLHALDPLMTYEEIDAAVKQVKNSGKVRFFGLSNMNEAQQVALEPRTWANFRVNQVQLSLAYPHLLSAMVDVNRPASPAGPFPSGLLELFAIRGNQLQAWGALGQGYLTGRDTRDQPPTIQQTAALIAQMAQNKGTTREAIALAWLLRLPVKLQPVIGTTNPQRIRACADAVRQSGLMTREEWYHLFTTARGRSTV